MTKKLSIDPFSSIIHQKSEFLVENHSAKLAGEFSRNDFNKADNVDNSNAIVILETKLPRDLWNLSITDQIGNITTSKAKYENDHIGRVTRSAYGPSFLPVRRMEIRLEYRIWPVSFSFFNRSDSWLYWLEYSYESAIVIRFLRILGLTRQIIICWLSYEISCDSDPFRSKWRKIHTI